MFKKLEVPILGMVLNQAYYQCPTCVEPKKEYIFGMSFFLSFGFLRRLRLASFSFFVCLRFFLSRTDEFTSGEPKAFQTLSEESQILILAQLPLI